MKNKKVFVLGIDGVTFDIINPMIKKGELPNFEKIMSQGIWNELKSTIPPFSGPAWTSFMTGLEPKDHGIFDFVLKKPNSYDTYYANYSHVSGEPFWKTLGNCGYKVIIQNIMVTYPPEPVNGLLITGGLTPPGRPYTYPRTLSEEIQKKFGGYPHLPIGGLNVANDEEKFIKTFYRNMEKRAKITRYLMKEKKWDLFTVMFEGADPLQHEFWHYIDKKHSRYEYIDNNFVREAIPNFYKKMDGFLGEVLNKLDEDTTIILVSDHGFGRLEKYIVVNNFLINIGMLKLKKRIETKLKKFLFDNNLSIHRLYEISKILGLNKARSKFRGGKSENFLNKLFLSKSDIDWRRTKAFSIGSSGHIYINRSNKEPEGAVENKEYNDVVGYIVEKLKALKDPITNKKVIEYIYTKDDIYLGRFYDRAPDISFLPENGYSTLHRDQFVSPSLFLKSSNSGGHRRNGIFIEYSPDVTLKTKTSEAFYIWDIKNLILYLFSKNNNRDKEFLEGGRLKETIKKLKNKF